ncbi:MAG: nuclear transport factor 2 family protein [Bacteroidota bacterium]
MTKNEKVIRDYYACHQNKDWNRMKNLLADGFTFTSPNDDDHINIDKFRERCWNPGMVKRFDIDKIIERGDEAFVRYTGVAIDGKLFRNTEYFKIVNGKIQEIDVFFGEGMAVFLKGQ